MNNTQSSPFKPVSEMMVDNLETLKVLADPLRLQIVKLLAFTPCTVKQIAAQLKLPPTKLYYHIKQLEEQALIQVVDTRVISGIIEKQYRAAAMSFRVSRDLLSPDSPGGQENLNMVLMGIFEETRDDIQKSIQAGMIDLTTPEEPDSPAPHSLMLWRGGMNLTEAEATEFHRRLKALLDEFDNGDEFDKSKPSFGFLLAFYPSVSRHTPHEET